MAKYVLIVNFYGGVVEEPMEEWKPEEITTHIDYYRALHKELVDSGELVARSNQGISHVLWLSQKTVETHIRGAFAKLGITESPEDNRRVLAVLAYLRQ